MNVLVLDKTNYVKTNLIVFLFQLCLINSANQCDHSRPNPGMWPKPDYAQKNLITSHIRHLLRNFNEKTL